ncbi:MAG: hypothetical protein ACRD2X_15725, partial [Vicinamibacteraceae bacterium]
MWIRTLALCLALLASAGASSQRWLDVPPADLAALTPADFRDDELDLPYHLAHFQRLATSVRQSGPDRGFIDLAVWRAPKDNQPYNARIMENILALAYFYTTDRPWNSYRGSASTPMSGVVASRCSRCSETMSCGRFSNGAFGMTHAEFQSPVGYFYEADGPDWGYNFNTHQSNLHGAWHYTRDTALGAQFVEEERRWAEWLSYNALLEPDGSAFVLNRGIETRQETAVLEAIDRPLAEEAGPLRAFATTIEELREARTRQRHDLEESWPQMAPLPVGEFWAFSPYTFLHRDHGQWHPTEAQRAAARGDLPANRERFTHQRMDSRHPLVFTYVRRPSYYAAFNSGERLTEQQRYGLGLVWAPGPGSVLQSQSGSAVAAWGTKGAGREQVYEAGDLDAAFRRESGDHSNAWRSRPGRG